MEPKTNPREEQIKAAAKMYKCRDTAKQFYKDEYPDKILFYKNLIVACQQKHKLEVLPSVMKLCEIEGVTENSMVVMLLMAAAVEIIEPTNS